jgi:hypothetical protein
MYCDNSTFDTRTEASPPGVTHMDRVSMKKFKFQGTTDVFMQCKIRACAQQPCGTCPNHHARELASSVDLSPIEGEMFAPPAKVQVSKFDNNALVFGAVQESVSSVPVQTQSQATGPTSKPITVTSEVTLPVTASWAIENRAALTSTLRSSLKLSAAEDLVITSITAARRLQQGSQQGGSAKIDFIVGVETPDRASTASSKLALFSSGSPAVLQEFVTILDDTLRNTGSAPLGLTPAQISFAKPIQTEVTTKYVMVDSQTGANANPAAANSKDSSSQDLSTQLFIPLCIALAAALIFMVFRGNSGTKNRSTSNTEGGEVYSDSYAAKISAQDTAVDPGFEFES